MAPKNNRDNNQPQAIIAAWVIVGALMEAGVRDVVVCPGSRSAPLAYAIAAAEDAGGLRAHICADERSGAFFALGMSKAAAALGVADADLGRFTAEGATAHQPPAGSAAALERPTAAPVAIVTTSGTAVANLHPAVLEATHSQVPLLVISADRPHHLRDTEANQTTNQVGIFGAAPVWQFDMPAAYPATKIPALIRRGVTAALGTLSNQPGVAHLNVSFDGQLTPNYPAPPVAVPPLRPLPGALTERRLQPSTAPQPDPAFPLDLSDPQSVVVAGDGAGPEAALVAATLGWPLLAEPSSRCRGADLPGLVAPTDYQALLGVREPTALAASIRQTLTFGHPTLSRPITRLLSAEAATHLVATSHAAWPESDAIGPHVLPVSDVLDQVRAYAGARPELAELHPGRWAQQFDDTSPASTELAEAPARDTRLDVCAQIWWAAASDGLPLYLGASSTIRLFDRAVGRGEVMAFANRGLAGIDGTLACARGLAAHTGMPTRVVVGDLTFLHDATSLMPSFARGQRPHPPLQVILLDDRGGSIFAGLEHGQAPQSTFDRFFRTPQELDYEAFARSVGARYRRIALSEAAHGMQWLTLRCGTGVELLHVNL